MTYSYEPLGFNEDTPLPLYSATPQSPVNSRAAKAAANLELFNNRNKGLASQRLRPSLPPAVYPPVTTPAHNTAVPEVDWFDSLPRAWKIFIGLSGGLFLLFILFCIAAFTFSFVLWGGAALVKISWIMLKSAFSAEVGLPSFGEAMNTTVGQNVSNISASIL